MQDNYLGCLVILAIGGGLAILGFLLHRSTHRWRMEILSGLAGRWNGRAISGGFLATPKLVLRVEDVTGVVSFNTGHNDTAWTKVQFNWAARRRLRVAPEGFMSGLRRLLGSEDVHVGEAEFDAAFWIESSDAPWAREILSGRVEQGLLNLHRQSSWLAPRAVTVDVGPAGLTLKFTRLLVDDPQRLESFIELAVMILEAVRGVGAGSGIVFAAVATKGGSCPMCGHTVEGGRRCPACRTPHHEDCWKYSGGCAIFACAGRPQKAA